MAQPLRLAFFGSTGGSVAASLVLALQGGYQCSTLVRSEQKLLGILKERNVSDAAIANHLRIVTGSVKDPEAVYRTLEPAVDIVISGVGGKPQFTPNPLKPTLDDPTICQDATRTIFDAIRRLGGPRPQLVVLSTTGISNTGRDIPIAMMPLYHWLLAVPHKDKKVMEDMIVAETRKPEAERAIDSAIIIRPSLLTNGPTTSMDKIRVGSDKEPQIGYTISRDDVGLWLFESAVKPGKRGEGARIVSITY
ncbi:uncharacterized protein IWZ02DRAFT_98626 [Phyllosticta citriasiana]|uniref:NAD(P)-binding domain-containing protein n=1 Tax=Phyllosticta citriasiana TaxID=595635 RepID=A0ABR1KNJ4_9PEZI